MNLNDFRDIKSGGLLPAGLRVLKDLLDHPGWLLLQHYAKEWIDRADDKGRNVWGSAAVGQLDGVTLTHIQAFQSGRAQAMKELLEFPALRDAYAHKGEPSQENFEDGE